MSTSGQSRAQAAARELVVVGVSHHTAPVEVRERLAAACEDGGGFLRGVTDLRGVQEAVLLSTCNRVEVTACCSAEPGGADALAGLLASAGGIAGGDLVFTLRGRDAVRHLFRVASSLDSMVVGEPQILGQLKTQFDLAAATDAAGPVLFRVFHKSFSVAKRVRTETGVASKSVSVAATAVDLATSIFETLEGRTVMLLGAGETGEIAARHLQAAGVGQVIVVNRTFENAVDLARELSATPVPLERFRSYLPLADLVVGSAGGGQILTADDVKTALRERRGNPMFFIDLAVPRNFDASIQELDGAYLYDIDDLGAVVEDNRGERRREAVKGEAIVEAEVDQFWQWFESLDVVPTIVELREYADSIRRAEVERALAKMSVGDEDRERIHQMTRAIVNKLLHHPTQVLKGEGSTVEESRLLTAVRRLFRLGTFVNLRVGTRRSPLALTQTRQAMEQVARLHGNVMWELVEIVTTGDRITDRPLRDAGGKGLFLKELDEALVEGRIDCAVHSLKDVPTELANGTTIAAVLERADVRDVLLSREGHALGELPPGTKIGTTSLRRQAQALARAPHARATLLRGNVETRLRKLAGGECDATFLALAGLSRLGFSLAADGTLAAPADEQGDRRGQHDSGTVRGVLLDPFEFLPAPGQGAVAITARDGDAETGAALAAVADEDTLLAVLAERAFARTFGGGCHLPLAAYASKRGRALELAGLLITPDGKRQVHDRVRIDLDGASGGNAARCEEMGAALGRSFFDRGAEEILALAAPGGAHR